MEKDITYRIVNSLIDDMQSRYMVDVMIAGTPNDRDRINTQVDMYEQWRHLISKELIRNGMINKEYERKTIKEIESMSLYNILVLRDFYLKLGQEDED